MRAKRALHSHYSSLSTNIMHHRLRHLSFAFGHQSPCLLDEWWLYYYVPVSLFMSLSQGFLLIDRWIWAFLTVTSLEDTATLVQEYCANFSTAFFFLNIPHVTAGLCNSFVANWTCSVLRESVLLVDDTSENYNWSFWFIMCATRVMTCLIVNAWQEYNREIFSVLLLKDLYWRFIFERKLVAFITHLQTNPFWK